MRGRSSVKLLRHKKTATWAVYMVLVKKSFSVLLVRRQLHLIMHRILKHLKHVP